MEAYSEEQLVELLHRGDYKALEEVIRRHSGIVAKVVKGMLGEVPEAEDVGQETFIRFWSRLDDYRHEAKLSTFLVRIAMNLSINELQRRKRRFGLFKQLVSNQKENEATFLPTFEDHHGNTQLVELALSKLDTEHRSVVVLRLIQGFSTKETAEMLKIPLGTVLSRLSRAQVKLRKIIEQLKI